MSHIAKYLDGVDNHLTDGGTFIIISFGEPKFRDKYLKRDNWGYKVIEIPLIDLKPKPKDDAKSKANKKKGTRRRKPKDEEKLAFYVYICTKGGLFVEKDKHAESKDMKKDGDNSTAKDGLAPTIK